MARTINEIYDEIITEKETQSVLNGLTPAPDDAQTLLADLTTTSKVAIWRLWYYTLAVAINIHENAWDLFKAEVEDRALEIITGTTRWYRDQSLLFQNGDALTYDAASGKYIYDPITPANQIIKRCAVIDTGAQVRIKIAKLDGSGKPIPLTAGEVTAYEGYLGQIKFAGTSTTVTSADADDLKLDLFIQYDPQVLDSNGADLNDPAVFPVDDAITAYIENIPFNGILNLTALNDSIQAAEGVLDSVINSAEAKFGLLPYSAINTNYVPDAGHLELDQVNSTITYTSLIVT